MNCEEGVGTCLCVSIALNRNIKDRGSFEIWHVADVVYPGRMAHAGRKVSTAMGKSDLGQSFGNLYVTQRRMNITRLIKELPVSVVIVL